MRENGVILNLEAGATPKVWLNRIDKHKLLIKVDLPPALGPVIIAFLGFDKLQLACDLLAIIQKLLILRELIWNYFHDNAF